MSRSGRPVLSLGLAAGLLTCLSISASAQQGSLQLSSAVQTVQGDPQRLAGQRSFEPDFGISWLQPGTRFGIFQIEIRGARRGDVLHTGRMYGALHDLKYHGATWTIEAGDTYFSPSISDYRFANLFAPAVTFNGGTVSGRTGRSSFAFVAGKTTAWRNIFGNDPEGLGQSIAIARGTHRPTTRVELSARASHVRTTSLREFSYTIDAGDQAGAGVKYSLTGSLHLVADGSLVSYRRTGSSSFERDASYMGGLNWLHSRGWIQINAAHFSPGDFPALNNPLQDREEIFAAGDYDLFPRMRVSAGWDRVRSNLNPEQSLASTRPTPQSEGDRGFGGVRVQITRASAFTVRGEQGTRQSRPVGPGLPSDSDTGMWAAEWQSAVGNTNAFIRYSERNNVEHLNQNGSYDQRDASAQLFTNLTRNSQLFGSAVLARTASAEGGGNTYWQAGGGAQLRMSRRDLWLRAEGNAARNMDLLTGIHVPRESLIFGLNGQMSRWTTVALNVNVDRTSAPSMRGSPWVTRSMLRVTRTLPTGSVYLPAGTAGGRSETGRGSGTISGLVFADWNGNGVQDTGDSVLEGIPLRAGAGRSTTGRDGQFSFMNVPTGTREVGLDTSALPIDFDAPAVPQVQIELGRGDTKRVAFGLVPLGSIQGRVVRDLNGNGKADPNEEPIDGAIVILDGGIRSEQSRRGRYRFDAVRSGDHRVKLLIESLPDGAVITGDPDVGTILSRDALAADVSFVISIQKRPEIRKVFPPRGGGAANTATPGLPRAASGRRAPPNETAGASRIRNREANAVAPTPIPRVRSAGGAFVIQVAALNDPLRAKDLVRELKAAGVAAYLLSPPVTEPDGPYRVRVGPYTSRSAAQESAQALETRRGEKLWVTREK